MNCLNQTLQYYAQWIGVSRSDLDKACDDIVYIKSENRNQTQVGYSKPFDIYCYNSASCTVLSYSSKAEYRLNDFIKSYKHDKSEISDILSAVYNTNTQTSVKYYFDSLQGNLTTARALDYCDYEEYLNFFMTNNPNCLQTGWVKEYFDDMVKNQLCFGVFEDSKLVCATDSPDVPYRKGKVAEIGINTSAEYRGRGYAKQACTAMIISLLGRNIAPLWSAELSNTASHKLAIGIGFKKLAEVMTLTL